MHMQALPVPLLGLGPWAAVVGRMCAQGANHDAANACLSNYFNNTNGILASLVSRKFPKDLPISGFAGD